MDILIDPIIIDMDLPMKTYMDYIASTMDWIDVSMEHSSNDIPLMD